MSVINLEPFLSDPESGVALEQCSALVRALRDTSVVVICDPRVSSDDNERYLDLGERYFAQPDDVIACDQRPEAYFQVGVSMWEKPRDHRPMVARMPPEHWPHLPPLNYPGDPRWRFFRNLGEPPAKTEFPRINAPQVVPAGFNGEWESTMDAWGNKMLASIYTIAEMIAAHFRLDLATFTRMFEHAPHLIAPNGVVLSRHQIGTIFNAYHYDMNWGTIHGRSRFPGLRIWPRSGEPFTVKVPEGCLLFQAARQLEWQTGGYFQAGFHEVVMLVETYEAMQRAIAAGRPPIRVSSTVFGHLASDNLLEVLPHFLALFPEAVRPAIRSMYPSMLVGDQIQYELEGIGWKPKE